MDGEEPLRADELNEEEDMAAAAALVMSIFAVRCDGVKTTTAVGRGWIEWATAERGTDAEAVRALTLWWKCFEATHAANPCEEYEIFPGALAFMDAWAARGVRLGHVHQQAWYCDAAAAGGTWSVAPFRRCGDGLRRLCQEARRSDAHPTFARLGCTAEDGVMIGDSMADVGCARAAGCPVVLVSFGYTPEPARTLGADAVVDGFDEILPILQMMQRSPMRA